MNNHDRTGTRLGALLLAALLLFATIPAAAMEGVMPGDVVGAPEEFAWDIGDWFDFDGIYFEEVHIDDTRRGSSPPDLNFIEEPQGSSPLDISLFGGLSDELQYHEIEAMSAAFRPVIVSPPYNGAQTPIGNAEMRWNAVSGATRYIISVRNLNTDRLLYEHHPIGNTTSFTIPQSLLVVGHQYRVAVAARVGTQYHWGDNHRTFWVGPNPPTVTAPSINGLQFSRATMPIVRWSLDPATSATYRVSLRSLTPVNSLLINQQGIGRVSSFTIPHRHLHAGHSYRLAVGVTVNGRTAWTERTFNINAMSTVTMNYNILTNSAGLGGNSSLMANRARGYVNDVKAGFWSTFRIDLVWQNSQGVATLNQRPGCRRPLALGCIPGAFECGGTANGSNCETVHHRSSHHFVRQNPGVGDRAVFRFVDYGTCFFGFRVSTNRVEHYRVNGVARGGSGNDMLVSFGSDNRQRTTAHEISHLFGARDGVCTTIYQSCVMRSGARVHDRWCDTCMADVLSGNRARRG